MVLQKRRIFQMTHISPVPLQFEGTPSQLEGSIGDGLQESAFIQGIRDNVRNKFYVVSNHCCVFPTDSKGIRDNVCNKFYVVSNHSYVFPTDSKGIRTISMLWVTTAVFFPHWQ